MRSVGLRRTRRRGLTIVEAAVADDSGPAKAVWFNQPWLAERLREGTRLLLYGKLDRSGFRVEAHEFADDEGGAGIHTTGLVPVHPASERLRPQRIRDWAWQVQPLARHALEPLPAELRARRRLAGAGDALATAHFPGDLAGAERARERLAFEELFLHQAALAARRQGRQANRPGISLGRPGELVERWLRVAALRAHRRSTARDRGDRRRPRCSTADAAAADGGGGLGQDRDRPVRDAARRRGGLPGRAHGAHGDAGRPARGVP